MEIIRFFAEHDEATLKELSTALSLAPSTCHRLLKLLGRNGFIESDPTRRRYRVGRELFRIAGFLQSKFNVREFSLPFLRQVVASCNETCILSIYVPSESKMFFAEKADSSRLLRYQLQMNMPMSMFWGASGRAILAFLDKEEVDRIYAMEGPAPATGEPLPARRVMEKQIMAIRRRGYDISYGQKVAGAVGISAPVFGVEGKVIGSLGITVPE
jgi:DNA-binding IclR family transcriptional regulator